MVPKVLEVQKAQDNNLHLVLKVPVVQRVLVSLHSVPRVLLGQEAQVQGRGVQMVTVDHLLLGLEALVLGQRAV